MSDEEQREPVAAPPPRGRRWKLAVTLGALLAGPLLAEAWMQYLIFHGSEPGDSVRDPGRYADPYSDDDYYKLQHVLAAPEDRRPVFRYDERLGWLSGAIEPGTYRHSQAERLAGRRPVLFYGASYAQCASEVPLCFQHLMERSELADEYMLLNYSVGNSGFDQMVLLLQATLDHYAGMDPIVVFGTVIETDFDRCMVAFRGWPKPRFRLTQDGGLALEGPVIDGPDAHIAAHPIEIRSYLWNHLLHGSEFLPDWLVDAVSDRDEKRRHKRELIRRLMDLVKQEVDRRGLDAFFLLMNGTDSLSFAPPEYWQESFVRELLRRRGIPYVLGRKDLLDAGRRESRDPTGFFFPSGRAVNHPTQDGTRVLFEALRRGLEGRFDGGA